MKKVIYTENSAAPIGPYSQAILANRTLFISGQIALDPVTGQMFKGNIEDETRKVMKSIGHILAKAGLGFRHVVKCSIFVKNMDDFQSINKVYGTFFETEPPARETIEVSALPKGANVEISCMVVLD